MLGTALIVALLGMSALIGQRIQNRMIVASADIRQAQLNANTAVELALLAMKQDTNWRTTYAERQLVRQPQHDGRHLHARTSPIRSTAIWRTTPTTRSS